MSINGTHGFERKKTYTDKTKLNPVARDDTLRSKDTKRSACARNWTVFISFFTSVQPHGPVLNSFTQQPSIADLLVHYRHLSLKWTIDTISISIRSVNALISLQSTVKQEEEEDASHAGCCVNELRTVGPCGGSEVKNYKYCSVSCTDRSFRVFRPQCIITSRRV